MRLEHANLKADVDLSVAIALRLLDALDLDVETRPRGSLFTPRPPRHLAELGLSEDAMKVVESTGLETIEDLGTAKTLLAKPEFEDGRALYEINCALNRYGLALGRRERVPGDRDREIFRLRVISGLTLDELGERFALNRERIRQILSVYFGLTGTPPAAKQRRRQRKTALQPDAD